MDTVKLLYWLLWNPHALEAYVKERMGAAEPTPVWFIHWKSFEAQAWRQRRAPRIRFFAHVLIASLLVVLPALGMLAWIATTGGSTPVSPLIDLAIGVGLGVFVAVVVFLALGYLSDLPAQAAQIGFWTGSALPILHYTQAAWGHEFSWNSNALLFFNILFGGLLGILANSVWGIMRRYRLSWWTRQLTALSSVAAFVIGVGVYNANFLGDYSVFTVINNWLWALLSFVLMAIRIDDYFYGEFVAVQDPKPNGEWRAPHVTPIMTLPVRRQFTLWTEDLDKWERGMSNILHVWQQTNLHGPLLHALRKKLYERSDRSVTEHTAQLLSDKYANVWSLEDFIGLQLLLPNLSLSGLLITLKHLFQPPRTKRVWFSSEPRSALHVRAVSPQPATWHGDLVFSGKTADAVFAGLYYLQKNDPAKASATFARAKGSDWVDEMRTLAEALNLMAEPGKKMENAPKLNFPKQPNKPKRPQSWQAVAKLKAILTDGWLYKRCNPTSPNRQRLKQAVDNNIQAIKAMSLPPYERQFIMTLTKNWEAQLASWFADSEKPIPPKKIEIGFQTKGVLHHDSMAGREADLDEIKAIAEEHYAIYLYGQAGTGKSSLLHHLPPLSSASFQPVIITLGHFKSGPSAHNPIHQQILSRLWKELDDRFGNISTPMLDASPHIEAKLQIFLADISRIIAGRRRLVIIVDQLNSAIHSIQEHHESLDRTLQFLLNLPEINPNLTIIFGGRVTPTTLQKLTGVALDADVATWKLSYFPQDQVAAQLNAPISRLIARFEDDAVEMIYKLSAGQPYLVQQIAQDVIDQFNQTLDAGGHPDPIFLAEDVLRATGLQQIGGDFAPADTAPLLQTPFWTQSQPYFLALLEQVKLFDVDGEPVLRLLAHSHEGMSSAELQSGLASHYPQLESKLEQILTEFHEQDLIHHDAATDKWQITAPLFRLYLH